MKTANKLFAATLLAAATSFSASANATVFAIDYHDVGVWNAYDTETETYAMKFRSDLGKDGFWLVVTDGDNPKGDGTSNAILYGDLENNRITAYTYNGENTSDSFTDGTLLGTYENVFSSGGTHANGYELTMFNLDVSEINGSIGADFDGVQLGEQAGIWFHQSAGSDFAYGADGSIVDYAFDSQMWLDRGNDYARNRGTISCIDGTAQGTVAPGVLQLPGYLNPCNATQIASAGNTGGTSGGSTSGGGSVPAPGGLALILVGLAGLGRKFRNKA